MLDEMLKQGVRSIEDARFVRDHFIPVALEQGRWNIVVYEAHRATELLVRGMTCQMGVKPPSGRKGHHDIARHVSFLIDHLPGMRNAKIPFIIGAYTDSESRQGYGVILSGSSPQNNTLVLCSLVHGSFSSMASTAKLEVPTSGRINLKLHLTPPHIAVDFNDERVLTATNSTYSGPFQVMDRTFVRQPDTAKIRQLMRWGDQLSKDRDAAYYEEKLYVKGDALHAIAYMKQSFDIAASFFSFE